MFCCSLFDDVLIFCNVSKVLQEKTVTTTSTKTCNACSQKQTFDTFNDSCVKGTFYQKRKCHTYFKGCVITCRLDCSCFYQ